MSFFLLHDFCCRLWLIILSFILTCCIELYSFFLKSHLEIVLIIIHMR